MGDPSNQQMMLLHSFRVMFRQFRNLVQKIKARRNWSIVFLLPFSYLQHWNAHKCSHTKQCHTQTVSKREETSNGFFASTVKPELTTTSEQRPSDYNDRYFFCRLTSNFYSIKLQMNNDNLSTKGVVILHRFDYTHFFLTKLNNQSSAVNQKMEIQSVLNF